jgi:hypothetical protein
VTPAGRIWMLRSLPYCENTTGNRRVGIQDKLQKWNRCLKNSIWAKEVAARTVLKKHKAEGHSKGH